MSFSLTIIAQNSLPANWQTTVKELAAAAAPEDGPGLAVSIAIGDEAPFTVFSGMANLEHQIPVQQNSRFHSGDLCNQFIAFGLFLLAEQGKIDLEGEIQTYLPTLPKFQEPVLVKHLVTHTHGLPNITNLQLISGWGNGGNITPEQVLELIGRHPVLSYTPGSQFNYDNTGFLIAAEIIESISGSNIADYISTSIFEPLGMSNSYFRANLFEIDALRAKPYILGRDGYIYGSLNYHQFPSDNMYSSAEDLGKWGAFLNSPSQVFAAAVHELNQVVDPDVESLSEVAKGRFLDNYRGLQRIHQGGLAYGNMSYMAHYPEQQLSVAVLSNDISFRASQLADQVADFLLAEQLEPQVEEEEESTEQHTEAPTEVSTEVMESYVGTYWEPNSQYARSIYLKNDTLFYSRNSGPDNALSPINDTLFRLSSTGNSSRLISFSNNSMELSVNASYTYYFEAYEAPVLERRGLDLLVGEYYSPNLATIYTITQKDGSLYLNHPRLGRIELQPYQESHFLTDRWFLAQVRFQTGPDGLPISAEVSSSDLSGVILYPIKR